MRTNSLSTCLAAFLILALSSCGDDAVAVDASLVDAPPVTGTFSMSWTISDGSGTITCGDVGASSVSVTLIPDGSFSGEVEAFSCASGAGASRGIAPGLYDVTIDVSASLGRSLLGEAVKLQDIEIVANNNTTLPAQEFVVEPVGSFSFFVDGDAAGGNCETVANGGAGIVGIEFGLKDSDGACVPTDFVVEAGSQSGGTYSSDCTTPPAPLPCIGKDQLIAVTTVSSGSYTMDITAQKEGPIDCYSYISSFTVVGAGLATEVGSLTLDLEYSLACDPDFTFPDGGLTDAGVPDGAP